MKLCHFWDLGLWKLFFDILTNKFVEGAATKGLHGSAVTQDFKKIKKRVRMFRSLQWPFAMSVFLVSAWRDAGIGSISCRWAEMCLCSHLTPLSLFPPAHLHSACAPSHPVALSSSSSFSLYSCSTVWQRRGLARRSSTWWEWCATMASTTPPSSSRPRFASGCTSTTRTSKRWDSFGPEPALLQQEGDALCSSCSCSFCLTELCCALL